MSAVWPLVTAWVEVAADQKSLLPSVGLIGHQRDATRFLDAAEEAHAKLMRAHDAAGLDRVRLASRLRNMAALLYPTPRGEIGDDGRVLLLAVRFDGLDAALCLYAPSEHGRGTVLLHHDVPGRKALVRIPADPTLLEFPERDIIAFKEEVGPARLETTLPTFSRRAKGSKGAWTPAHTGGLPAPGVRGPLRERPPRAVGAGAVTDAVAPNVPLADLRVGDVLRSFPGGVYHRVEAIDLDNKRVSVLPLYVVDGALYAPDTGDKRRVKWILGRTVVTAGSGARAESAHSYRGGYEYVPSSSIRQRW